MPLFSFLPQVSLALCHTDAIEICDLLCLVFFFPLPWTGPCRSLPCFLFASQCFPPLGMSHARARGFCAAYQRRCTAQFATFSGCGPAGLAALLQWYPASLPWCAGSSEH
ncbi:hypothetical protein HDV63DRAFT_172612 [Trichoderma sp. SZMC 28014]